MLCRRLCLPSLCNRHFLEVSNTSAIVCSKIDREANAARYLVLTSSAGVRSWACLARRSSAEWKGLTRGADVDELLLAPRAIVRKSQPWTRAPPVQPSVQELFTNGQDSLSEHRHGSQNRPSSPSIPITHPNATWMGVFDPSGSPPFSHLNSLWMGFLDRGPVRSHRHFVQHNRFFPALVRAAEQQHHLIGPASCTLLWWTGANCSPRTCLIWSSVLDGAGGTRSILAFVRYNSHN